MGGALRIRGVAMRPWPVSIEDVSAAVRVLMRNATIFTTFLEHRCSSMADERVRVRRIPFFGIHVTVQSCHHSMCGFFIRETSLKENTKPFQDRHECGELRKCSAAMRHAKSKKPFARRPGH